MNPEQPLSQNPGVARSRPVTVLFLLALVLVPIGQATWELRRGEDVHALEVFGPLDGERLRAFDEDLRERSFLQKVAVRWYQAYALRWMGRGNSKAFVGSDGWLYYRDDLDYVTRPGSFESDGRAAVEGITISDLRLPDNPLVYVNRGFSEITGYSREESIGRNCRYLQGPDTNPEAIAEIREAIAARRSCIVEILKSEGYINDFSIIEKSPQDEIEIGGD